MLKSKNYSVSLEVYNYPYGTRSIESTKLLSEKLCVATITIRKKFVRKTKRGFVYLQLFLALGNGLVPAQPVTPLISMGLPPLTIRTSSLMK